MNIEGRTEARFQLTTSLGEDERTPRHQVAPYTPGWKFHRWTATRDRDWIHWLGVGWRGSSMNTYT